MPDGKGSFIARVENQTLYTLREGLNEVIYQKNSVLVVSYDAV